MRFTYRSGQRPLDGYTVKRGVGAGGFGEVYFAVSDGGKEVALKLVRGHTETELRGIAQCLNLKHPNLVHLYDLRTDATGDRWVVMEYVLGESLAQVLNRHPTGLPAGLAADWFASLARGVGYLHDHGVVHRDLKPANVFVEQGQLKVGDYGLCKAMSGSQRAAQTQSVGTVHYMAPEVSTGNYNRSIDVYACGVILYEMLTGRVPFDGETAGEILMKHLTAPPDLSVAPAAFRDVLGKALDKNPARRFAGMAEFARAVEAVAGDGAAREPSPVAAAGPVPAAAAAGKPATGDDTTPDPPPQYRKPVPAAAPAVYPNAPAAVPPPAGVRGRLGEFFGSAAAVPLVAALCTIPWAAFAPTVEWTILGRVFLLTTALSWAALAAGRVPRGWHGGTGGRRLAMVVGGLSVGALAFWLDGWGMPTPMAGQEADVQRREQYFGGAVRVTPEAMSAGVRYLMYFAAAAGMCRWWRTTDRRRRERFSLFPPIAAGFWGVVFLFLWPWDAAPASLGVVPLVLTAVVVQAVSPWAPPPPPPPKKLRLRYA